MEVVNGTQVQEEDGGWRRVEIIILAGKGELPWDNLPSNLNQAEE